MMNKNEQLNGQFRHLLTIGGGYLVAKGIATAEEVDLLSALAWLIPGIVASLIGLVKSWRSKAAIDKEAELVERVILKLEERNQIKNNGGG